MSAWQSGALREDTSSSVGISSRQIFFMSTQTHMGIVLTNALLVIWRRTASIEAAAVYHQFVCTGL